MINVSEKLNECIEKLKDLVCDVQGAPFPGAFNNELYTIWYEHIQNHALDAFEFLNAEIPDTTTAEVDDIIKTAF